MTNPQKLSLFWIFLYLNYIFCDVFSLMYPPLIQEMATTGMVNGIAMTEGMLFGFGVVMEAGMLMVVGARLLPYGVNRVLNIVVGAGLILLQLWSLSAGENLLHYWFFSVVEIVTLAVIVWTAATWRRDA